MVSARSLLKLAVAVALVTVPLWGPALALTGDRYEYRATLLDPGNGTLGVAGDPSGPPYAAGDIDCFAAIQPARACALDAGLVNGSRTVDYPALGGGTGAPPFRDERYVAFGLGSPVYERTARYADGGGGQVTFGLERVPPREALREVAVDLSRAPAPVRETVDTGVGVAREPLSENPIVRVPPSGGVDARYFLVYDAGRRDRLSANPGDEAVLELLAVVVGVLLLVDARPPLGG
jgi:hypothetical protein